MTPIITAMDIQHLNDVLKIQAECYLEVVPESEESVRAKLLASPQTCFVACIDDQIVAYLIALPWRSESPPELDMMPCHLPALPNTLYLHDLAVSLSARGTGVGKLLVNCFFESARSLGLERCNLIAVQNSEQYWSRFGFKTQDSSAALAAKLATYGTNVKYMECAL